MSAGARRRRGPARLRRARLAPGAVGVLLLLGLSSVGHAAVVTLERTLSGPLPSDFGAALATHADTVLVGIPRLNLPTGAQAGSVQLIDPATGALEHTFVSTTATPGDRFGEALAVSGTALFVGASGGGARGVVQQFDLNTHAWVRTFANPGTSTADGFGMALAVVGDRLVVGAPFFDTTGGGDTAERHGAAYVFDLATGTPLKTCLDTPAPEPTGAFGWALAAAGTQVVIGSPFGFGAQGEAGFWQIDGAGGGCTRLTSFPSPAPAVFNLFGAGVAALGADVLVAEPNANAVHRFATSGLWRDSLLRPGASGQYEFGMALATLGSLTAVGAPADGRGTVYLYDPDATNPSELRQTVASPATSDGRFGDALALTEDWLLVGAPRSTTVVADQAYVAGRVYVYRVRCGNDVLDTGEQCDDGNTTSGDCCSAGCVREPNGAPCTDGEVCSIGTTCQDGVCGTCDVGTPCQGLCVDGLCGTTPAGACRCLPTTTSTSTSSSSSTSATSTSSSSSTSTSTTSSTTSTSTTTTTTTSSTSTSTTSSTSSTSTSTTLPNQPPVAVLPPTLTVLAGQPLYLDGRFSFDPDGSPITSYQWALTPPTGSGATLDDATTPISAFTPDLANEDYTVSLVVHDGTDSSPPATLVVTAVDSSPLGIAITSPASEAAVTTTQLLVDGTTAGGTPSAPVGVTINGIPAVVTPGTFVAADVPLAAGLNVLTATVAAVSGETLTTTRRVTSDGSVPTLTLTATPVAALAPAEVTFAFDFTSSEPIQSFALDVDGDGTAELTDPAGPLVHTYTTGGVFVATLTVVDAMDATFVATRVVEVLEPTAVDQELRALWDGMNAALVAGDVATATARLTPEAQAKFEPIWTTLLSQMGGPAGIVSSLNPLTGVAMTSETATYLVTRDIGGETQGFFVTLVRGPDGLWRLGEM